MTTRSLESSKLAFYMSSNFSISELERLAEGFTPSVAPSTLVTSKKTDGKKPSLVALKIPTTAIPSSRSWGGSTHHFQLAVTQGNMFIPNKFRPPPEANSFETTRDLGSPGATRRWVIHVEDFRDNEISFQLHKNKLTARGYQTTRRDSPKRFSQSIELPNPFCIDCLKVYRNKRLGTIIIALLPDSFPFFRF